MRERAAKMGAVLTIKTAPGQGVEIEIVSPLHTATKQSMES
jgi:signal transduction histidine kinase